MRRVGLLLVAGVVIWYLYVTGSFDAVSLAIVGSDAPPPKEKGFEKSQLQGIVIVLCGYILLTSFSFKK